MEELAGNSQRPDLAPQVWEEAVAAADAGDLETAADRILDGVADLEVTLGAGVTLNARAHDYLREQHGEAVLDAIASRSPLEPDAVTESEIESGLSGLRELARSLTRAAPPDPERVKQEIWRQLNRLETVHHNAYDLIALTLTVAAEKLGENVIEPLWRHMLAEAVAVAGEMVDLPIEERIKRINRMFTGHFGGPITVERDRDRFRVTHDPCGSGGRMRREGGFGGTTEFGKTTEAHPWSWGKAGVPYYCVHCCILWETDQIDNVGFPVRIHEGMDDPRSPISHLYYDDPGDIPEHFFRRVGGARPGGDDE